MEALQKELAELENETTGDVDAVIGGAEENVLKQAESSSKGVEEATETLAQAEQEISESVEKEAESAANELGRPELADEIADRLFQRIEERGLLTPSAPQPSPEAEPAPEDATETVEKAPGEAQAAVAETAEQDTPPEPQHWFYRKRFRQ